MNGPSITNTPYPLIKELIVRLKDKQWFTKFDVCWEYNNIYIKEGDQWKAAFKMNRGLFKPTVMFFGLTNSPATFQTMMDDVKRVSAGEFEGRLVPMLEIRGRSVSDPTVENTHLGTAARLDAFSGREAKQGRIEKRKRGR